MIEDPHLTTPDAILRKALEKEQQAHDFYEQHAAHCHIDYVRELLETLQNEESKHIHIIKDMIRRIEAGHDPL